MDHWASALEQHWGIRAKLKRLDGEYDLNFLAETPEGSGYVIKAMRPGCEDWLVDLQIQTLDHIAKANLSLPCPAVVAALSGEKMLHLQDDAGETRLVWVIERLLGQCYAHAAPKTEQLIAEVGGILGATTATLRDFEHPKLSRDFKWDLMRADWVAKDLACIEDGARKTLIRKICDQYQALKPGLDR
ncbi:peptidase M23, partial [Rhodobacteraceae bacterium R_SAG5]|nr:peptidase M23 [Rhodobacteraceae bacterium R_SAG5]